MAMLGEMPMAEVRRKLWRIKTRGKCGVSLHDATDLRLSCHLTVLVRTTGLR